MDIAPLAARIAALLAADTGVAFHLPDKRQAVDSPVHMAGSSLVADTWVDRFVGSRVAGEQIRRASLVARVSRGSR